MLLLRILILALILLSSCGTKKKVASLNDIKTIVSNRPTLIDTGIKNYHLTLPIVYSERLISTVPENNNYRLTGLENNNNILENRYNIIDLIDTTKFSDSSFAIIGYNIPNSFRVSETSTIKLRISRENRIESIVIGDRNIPIVGINSEDKIILESIRVSEEMMAKLYTDSDYFLVELVNTNPNQKISELGYSEWVWRITPLKSGKSYIKMIITQSGRDIVVYEREIPVESNWVWSFSNWFTKWWQAITTTIVIPIIIPFLVWFIRRRKSNAQ